MRFWYAYIVMAYIVMAYVVMAFSVCLSALRISMCTEESRHAHPRAMDMPSAMPR